MKTEYVIRGYLAFSEKDNFETGCNPDTTKSMHVGSREWVTHASTLQNLVDVLADEFRADRVDLSTCDKDSLPYIGGFIFDSCEEEGRIDLQVYQRRPFQVGKPSEETQKQWRAGKADLWLTCYSFSVEKVVSGFSLISEIAG